MHILQDNPINESKKSKKYLKYFDKKIEVLIKSFFS